MKAHMYWMQGWDKAPPRALRNLEAWQNAGFDVLCWDDSNAGIKWNKHIAPAMRADIVVSKAQFKYGGLATGADTLPLDIKSFLKSIDFLPQGIGQIVWQSGKSFFDRSDGRPYNDLSYFPKENKFIEAVCKNNAQHLKTNFLKTPKPINFTGPNVWLQIFKKYAQHVNIIAGEKAFEKEPRINERSDVAWFDCGVAYQHDKFGEDIGDWYGDKPGHWE